ncbi:hypothetical protein D3C87_1701510 [compost metagenome]
MQSAQTFFRSVKTELYAVFAMIHSNLYIDLSGSLDWFAASESARAQYRRVIHSINLAVNRDQAIDEASCVLRSAQRILFLRTGARRLRRGYFGRRH